MKIVVLLFVCAGIVYGEEKASTHVPKLLSEASFIEATAGEDVSFPCAVDDIGDYVLLWKKGKSTILYAGELKISRESRHTLEGSTLHISGVQPQDSGEYVCSLSTTTPVELVHTLNVLYPPTVKPQPSTGEVTAKEGETINLSCSAKGNPAPTIKWIHAGREYRRADSNTFQITSAQKSDSGEYECIADNKVGNPASAIITVDVVSAPKVTTFPENGLSVVKEDEPIALSCKATGDPMPTITWKRPHGIVGPTEGNKIFIEKAHRKDAGTYECVANNSLGVSASGIVRVQVLFGPEVHAPHNWIHAGEGATVNISCSIQGEPAPSVMWKRGGSQPIHPGGRYDLRAAGHLHWLEIRRLQEQDFGRYDCVASNSLSSATESVHVIGTPQVPVFTSKPHGPQSSKYTISWVVDSHTPVDEYSLMYRKKSGDGEWESKTIPASERREDGPQTQVFQLLDLEAATSYEAVVTARNKFGWSKQSEALVFTTRREAVVIPYADTTPIPTLPDLQQATMFENGTISEEDKHSEKMGSSASIQALSFALFLPVFFISIERQMSF